MQSQHEIHQVVVMVINSCKWLLAIFLVSVLAACASATKVSMPHGLKAMEPDTARIVVTREKQLAGKYTPVYIMDIGSELESNGEIVVRIGKWIEEPGLSLWYMPSMLSSFSSGGFTLMPTTSFSFSESDLNLDDLLNQNQNGVIYVDYLSCNEDQLNTLYCGDGKSDCDTSFRQELMEKEGRILNTLANGSTGKNRRSVQVVGKILGGDTLIWERKPGLMRIGALWGALDNKIENIVEITPGNIIVEAGNTYFLKYEISLGDHTSRGDRWTITGVE